MDKKLESYFKFESELNYKLQSINENVLARQLERRSERQSIILLSLASLLWLLLLTAAILVIGIWNKKLGILLLSIIVIQQMCAGLYSYLIFKFKKVGD